MSHPLGHRVHAFARTTPTAFVAVLLLLAAVLLTALLQPGTTSAGFDPDKEGTLTAPADEGSPALDWQGTVPPGTGGVSVDACLDGINSYYYTIHLEGITPGYFDTHDGQLTVRILWDPNNPTSDPTTQDLALFIRDPSQTVVASSDGGTNQEFAIVGEDNLENGDYTVIVCTFAALNIQEFNALASLNISLAEGGGGDTLPDPEDGDRGFLFSATTVVDPQRDVAEPSLRVDLNNNVYACGPFGASRAAEYANKSEDGGDTFRVLGQPPEGRIAPGGGGDCELATGTEPLSDTGEYNLAYTGLEALANFSTARSTDGGRTFAGQVLGVTDAGVDRQWMEGVGQDTVYLGYNEIAQGYRVARSDDGGLTYGLPVTAVTDIFRPGPIRVDLDTTHNPDADNEIVYFTFTRADSVWIARSYDRGATWEEFMVAGGDADPFNPNNLFSALAIDTAGNLYSAWTEKGSFNTYYAYSLRPAAGAGGAGETWSEKRLVNRNPVLSTVMPWIEAGDPGRISVSYYGSPSDGNIEVGDFDGYWHVYVSISFNALDAVDTNGNVPFSLSQATTHPVHYDSICVSGLGCTITGGDRTLLDFFQNRLDRDGHIHVVFNQSNKVPGAAAGRIAIVTYVKQIAGPSLYAAARDQNADERGGVVIEFPDPRPVVRDTSTDPIGDAEFPFSQFGPQQPARTDISAFDITNFIIRPSCTDGLEAGSFEVELDLVDISDAALAEALAVQTATGSPASSLLFVVRWFSGTDPYSAVAKWTPAGFTFGFNDLTVDTTTGRLETYPGNDAVISGERIGNTTLRMTIQPSQFQSIVLPAQPDGDPVIRPAVVGDRIFDVTAFTFGNVSVVPEEQTYLNQGDSTAPFDHVLQPADPQECTPTAVTLGGAGTTPIQRDWLPLLVATGALIAVGSLALVRRRFR